jgi:ferredoxin
MASPLLPPAEAWRRPQFVRIVEARCIACGICRALAPALLQGEPIRVSRDVLDAMALCPTGAIQWIEQEEE